MEAKENSFALSLRTTRARGGAALSVACAANVLVEEALGARTPLARRRRAQPRARGAAEHGHGQARAQDAARGRALRRRLRVRVAPPARARLSSASAVTAAFHACGHLVACLCRSCCRGRRACLIAASAFLA